MAEDRGISGSVRPLTKKIRVSGELYCRRPEVEVQITEVLMLSNAEILERKKTRSKDAAGYLLDETIVHLIRNNDPESDFVNELFGELSARVALLSKTDKYFKIKNEDADELLQTACFYLVKQLFSETDIGDFAEVRFGKYISSFLNGERKKLLVSYNRDAKNQELDEPNEEGHDFELPSGEPTIEDAMIIASMIDELPEKTRIAAALIADGFQIESKDPDEPTVSKIMKVSSRTIRNWMDDARKSLTTGGTNQ